MVSEYDVRKRSDRVRIFVNTVIYKIAKTVSNSPGSDELLTPISMLVYKGKVYDHNCAGALLCFPNKELFGLLLKRNYDIFKWG